MIEIKLKDDVISEKGKEEKRARKYANIADENRLLIDENRDLTERLKITLDNPYYRLNERNRKVIDEIIFVLVTGQYKKIDNDTISN